MATSAIPSVGSDQWMLTRPGFRSTTQTESTGLGAKSNERPCSEKVKISTSV